VPRYLSPEWFEAAQAAIDAASGPSESIGESLPDSAMVVEHVVTGTGEGDVTYHLRLEDGGVRLERGAAGDAIVVFTESYDTAAAIARGDLSAQTAFMAGRIRVRGDLSRLMEQSEAFRDIEGVLAGLRSETTY
jgi:hypothetical protein